MVTTGLIWVYSDVGLGPDLAQIWCWSDSQLQSGAPLSLWSCFTPLLSLTLTHSIIPHCSILCVLACQRRTKRKATGISFKYSHAMWEWDVKRFLLFWQALKNCVHAILVSAEGWKEGQSRGENMTMNKNKIKTRVYKSLLKYSTGSTSLLSALYDQTGYRCPYLCVPKDDGYIPSVIIQTLRIKELSWLIMA